MAEVEIENEELIIEVIVNPPAPLEVELVVQPDISIPNFDYSAIAGMDMSSGRFVVIQDGLAKYFNPNSLSMYGLVTGITKTSALIGQAVGIKLSGVFYESGLGLTPDTLYFAGLNGTLTTNPTGLKIVQQVGNALNENSINININSPIETI